MAEDQKPKGRALTDNNEQLGFRRPTYPEIRDAGRYCRRQSSFLKELYDAVPDPKPFSLVPEDGSKL